MTFTRPAFVWIHSAQHNSFVMGGLDKLVFDSPKMTQARRLTKALWIAFLAIMAGAEELGDPLDFDLQANSIRQDPRGAVL